jgi:hypothetical protein
MGIDKYYQEKTSLFFSGIFHRYCGIPVDRFVEYGRRANVVLSNKRVVYFLGSDTAGP